MPQPKYQQIAEELRERIASGKLAPGAQLPTEIELRETYDASRNTIRDAIKRLTSLSLVETRPGQGTFVVQRIDPFVTELPRSAESGEESSEGPKYLSAVSKAHREPRVTTPKVEVQVPREEIRRRLRMRPGAQVVSRHQERYIDEIAWSLQTSYYPIEFALGPPGAPDLLMAKNIDEGAVRYIETMTGIKQVGIRDWITARNPDRLEQIFFKIAHDATMFQTFRTGFDKQRRPIRVTETVCPADRNQFIVNIGDVPPPQYEWEI
jgi:GntR family transcriptional regulator